MRAVWPVLLAACAPETAPSATAPTSITDNAGYLAACEEALGPWPVMSCKDAVEVPITVTDADGTRVVRSLADLEGGIRCDRASIGGCAPGTRIGATVNERGATFAFGCRNYDDDLAFDQINVIATLPGDGATCFFDTHAGEQRFLGTTVLPRPGSAEDTDRFGDPFWRPFEELQGSPCLQCHDNDAILRNPWVEQTGVLPTGDPDGPYWLVAHEELMEGDALWQPPRMLADPDAAPCLACHRLGERRSCTLALEAVGRVPRGLTTRWYQTTWPEDHWMPTFDLGEVYASEDDWDADYGAAADAIERCCVDDPPPGCFADP